MNEVIKVNFDTKMVSARELHEKLNIRTRFNDWFPRMCEYGFEDGKDFYSTLYRNTGGRPSKDAEISIDMAKDICRKQRKNKHAARVLKYLLSLDNKEIYYIECRRKEYEFSEMLDKITGYDFLRQYPIAGGKYRLTGNINCGI